MQRGILDLDHLKMMFPMKTKAAWLGEAPFVQKVFDRKKERSVISQASQGDVIVITHRCSWWQKEVPCAKGWGEAIMS